MLSNPNWQLFTKKSLVLIWVSHCSKSSLEVVVDINSIAKKAQFSRQTYKQTCGLFLFKKLRGGWLSTRTNLWTWNTISSNISNGGRRPKQSERRQYFNHSEYNEKLECRSWHWNTPKTQWLRSFLWLKHKWHCIKNNACKFYLIHTSSTGPLFSTQCGEQTQWGINVLGFCLICFSHESRERNAQNHDAIPGDRCTVLPFYPRTPLGWFCDNCVWPINSLHYF